MFCFDEELIQYFSNIYFYHFSEPISASADYEQHTGRVPGAGGSRRGDW